MGDEALEVLVRAISSPSLVDILLLVVTTAYFFATCLIFIENHRSANASITASNVTLLDVRVALVDRIRNLSVDSSKEEVKYCENRTKILFPNKFLLDFKGYAIALQNEKRAEQKYYDIISSLHDAAFGDIDKSAFESLEEAIIQYSISNDAETKAGVVKILNNAKDAMMIKDMPWQDPIVYYEDWQERKRSSIKNRIYFLEGLETYLKQSINSY